MLSCGFHRCPERCHRGPCIETCRVVVTKSCRCGSLRKEQFLVIKIWHVRGSVREYEIVGAMLVRGAVVMGTARLVQRFVIEGFGVRITNVLLHAIGVCAPCPVMVTISCACGETHFEVPCGTEKEQKPPRCPKPCCIIPLCRHGPNCKRCHGPKPPPNPEFTLKPKKKKSKHHSECIPGSPCPPCPELVWRSCVGEHVGEERMMVCSNIAEYSCNNLCGNLLPCGNHYCTKVCHALKSQSSSLGRHGRGEFCEECDLPCQKERQPACPHPCPRPCHLGECPPCKVLIRRSCHCGSMVHVFECLYYNSMSEKEQMTVRSCGGPCHSLMTKLPYCTHLCPEICHPGQCPAPEKCSKKVTVRCGCQTLKKEWLCHDVQAAYRSARSDLKDISKNQYGLGLLPCNSGCRSKVKVADTELQHRKSTVLKVLNMGALLWGNS
ncbi:unnamed protein product [Camellia sinensis]